MKKFLETEAITGGLHNKYPPENNTNLYGPQLWHYLESVFFFLLLLFFFFKFFLL
jgi:hypothetical protein